MKKLILNHSNSFDINSSFPNIETLDFCYDDNYNPEIQDLTIEDLLLKKENNSESSLQSE